MTDDKNIDGLVRKENKSRGDFFCFFSKRDYEIGDLVFLKDVVWDIDDAYTVVGVGNRASVENKMYYVRKF